MDIQVQELIDKIKKEGINEASIASKKIIDEANESAKKIIDEAKAKADEIEKQAKLEAARLEKASEASIAQAGRNLLISFREGIEKELDAILSSEISTMYDAATLKKLIPDVVSAWISKPDAQSVDVLLSEKDCKNIEAELKSALKVKLSKGVEIKPDPNLSVGFKIASKDGSAYYDFSAQTVSELFANYLNPRVAEILKNATKGTF